MQNGRIIKSSYPPQKIDWDLIFFWIFDHASLEPIFEGHNKLFIVAIYLLPKYTVKRRIISSACSNLRARFCSCFCLTENPELCWINLLILFHNTSAIINLLSTFGFFVEQKPSWRIFDRRRAAKVINFSVVCCTHQLQRCSCCYFR